MSIISCCLLHGVPMVAEGVIYFICVQWHISNIRLFHSLLLIIILPHLRGLSANLTARGYVKGNSVNCFCSDISYIHYMSVSCPSGLFICLPSAGYQSGLARVRRPRTPTWCNCWLHRMFQALDGQDRYPAVPSDLPQ